MRSRGLVPNLVQLFHINREGERGGERERDRERARHIHTRAFNIHGEQISVSVYQIIHPTIRIPETSKRLEIWRVDLGVLFASLNRLEMDHSFLSTWLLFSMQIWPTTNNGHCRQINITTRTPLQSIRARSSLA